MHTSHFAFGSLPPSPPPIPCAPSLLPPHPLIRSHIPLLVLPSSPPFSPPLVQEYNICFTTVERPADGTIPPLPPGAGGGSLAPLPLVIQGLVARRREVKAQMKVCVWGVCVRGGETGDRSPVLCVLSLLYMACTDLH